MAGGEIIGAAVGVLLLVFVAYVLVGSTLSTAEIVANAQKDLTLLDESRLRTDISITYSGIDAGVINFSVKNNGNEMISDFRHMDILSFNESSNLDFQHYTYNKNYDGTPGTWTVNGFIPEKNIHPNILDPGETMWCNATFIGETPRWFQVTTGNGVYTSAYIT